MIETACSHHFLSLTDFGHTPSIPTPCPTDNQFCRIPSLTTRGTLFVSHFWGRVHRADSPPFLLPVLFDATPFWFGQTLSACDVELHSPYSGLIRALTRQRLCIPTGISNPAGSRNSADTHPNPAQRNPPNTSHNDVALHQLYQPNPRQHLWSACLLVGRLLYAHLSSPPTYTGTNPSSSPRRPSEAHGLGWTWRWTL